MVDAALGLQKLGHKVDIYTSHHDPNHCFEETKDGEQFQVTNYRIFADTLQEHSASIMSNRPSPAQSEGNCTYSSLMLDNYTSQPIYYLNQSHPTMFTSWISSPRVYRSSGS